MTDGTEIGNQEPIRLSEITLNYKFSEYNKRLDFLDKIAQESFLIRDPYRGSL